MARVAFDYMFVGRVGGLDSYMDCKSLEPPVHKLSRYGWALGGAHLTVLGRRSELWPLRARPETWKGCFWLITT